MKESEISEKEIERLEKKRQQKAKQLTERCQQRNSKRAVPKKKKKVSPPASKPVIDEWDMLCKCGCGELVPLESPYRDYVNKRHYLRAFKTYGRRREVPKEDQMAVEQILNGGQMMETPSAKIAPTFDRGGALERRRDGEKK